MSEPAHILIVDDYPASRYALARMVRQQGYQARELASARALLEALDEPPVDLVILDVHLPDGNGFELCRRLKSDDRFATLPVIVVSATYTSADNRERTLAAGADAYLEQPILAPELAAEIERLLLRRRGGDGGG